MQEESHQFNSEFQNERTVADYSHYTEYLHFLNLSYPGIVLKNKLNLSVDYSFFRVFRGYRSWIELR